MWKILPVTNLVTSQRENPVNGHSIRALRLSKLIRVTRKNMTRALSHAVTREFPAPVPLGIVRMV